jgi:hypothetical protein
MCDDGTEAKWSDYVTTDPMRVVSALVTDLRMNNDPETPGLRFRSDHPTSGKVTRWEITLVTEG